MKSPEHPIGELPKLHASKRQTLSELGVETIDQVPEDFSLTPLQARVRECVLTGREYIGSDLAARLAEPV